MKKASAQNFKGESMLPRYHLDLYTGMPYTSQQSGIGDQAVCFSCRLLGSGCFPHRTRTCSECPLSEERRMENSFPHRIFCIAYLLCHFCGWLSTEIAEFAGFGRAERPVLIWRCANGELKMKHIRRARRPRRAVSIRIAPCSP